MATDAEKALTVKELAAIWDMSEATIYRLTRSGQLRHFQPGGKRHSIRFPASVADEVNVLCQKDVRDAAVVEKPIPGPKPKLLTES